MVSVGQCSQFSNCGKKLTRSFCENWHDVGTEVAHVTSDSHTTIASGPVAASEAVKRAWLSASVVDGSLNFGAMSLITFFVDDVCAVVENISIMKREWFEL